MSVENMLDAGMVSFSSSNLHFLLDWQRLNRVTSIKQRLIRNPPSVYHAKEDIKDQGRLYLLLKISVCVSSADIYTQG